jgi:hypothetical protein
MSLNAISPNPSAALPTVNFHPHGHRRGAHADSAAKTGSTSSAGNTSSLESTVGSVGQLPVGAASGLFGTLLQSLQQVVGAQSATSVSGATAGTAAASPASGATAASGASPALKQDLQAFLHSLFQVLKQDGLGKGASAASPAATATAGSSAIAATPAGSYQGGLVSSLQSLIQQLGANGTANAATSNLNASFNRLATDLQASGAGIAGAGIAAPNSATSPTSSAALQTFLNGLLQNLQSNGVHSLNAVGTNVNANV